LAGSTLTLQHTATHCNTVGWQRFAGSSQRYSTNEISRCVAADLVRGRCCVAVCCSVFIWFVGAVSLTRSCQLCASDPYLYRLLVLQQIGHTATRCDTLRHTATHCNTLQSSALCYRLGSLSACRAQDDTATHYRNEISSCAQGDHIFRLCTARHYISAVCCSAVLCTSVLQCHFVHCSVILCTATQDDTASHLFARLHCNTLQMCGILPCTRGPRNVSSRAQCRLVHKCVAVSAYVAVHTMTL